MLSPLPIDAHVAGLLEVMRAHPLVLLQAEPGAGKTTRIPPALVESDIAAGASVVCLEPRRVAARAAALRVADERGWSVGQEVGYRVRHESRGGPSTRLWYSTEGNFTRRLAEDPFLDGVAVVVLDEFHERHVAGDFALAALRELQRELRPDLRLLLLSATLDSRSMAPRLGNPPVLCSEGRQFPVEISHAGDPGRSRLEERVRAAVIREGSADPRGDVLVFLPGRAEMGRCRRALEDWASENGSELAELHGGLPLDAQQRLLRAGERRRIVLSTNIAESSLTLAGVSVVIDSGLARIARFDSGRGVDVSEVRPISRAAAVQRAGRAGRLRPGRCRRLFEEADFRSRRDAEVPEILRVDLAPLALELAAWGLAEAGELPWLDPPPPAAWEAAGELLRDLGALDRRGQLTDLGRRLAPLPLAPRLGRVLLAAESLGHRDDGALLAALAGERDPRRRGPESAPWPTGPSDLLLLRQLYLEARASSEPSRTAARLGFDRGGYAAVERSLRSLRGKADRPRFNASDEVLLRSIAAAYPDRVARRRESGSPRAVDAGGSGVVLAPGSVVRDAELFVCLDLRRGGRSADSIVEAASELREEWLPDLFGIDAIDERERLEFDPASERVVATRERRYRQLTLEARQTAVTDDPRAAELLVAAARAAGTAFWDPATRGLLARLAFLRRELPSLVIPEEDELLGPLLEGAAWGKRRLDELRTADWVAQIRGSLSSEARNALEGEAPASCELPSGRRVDLHYPPDAAPWIEARIQETFGWGATPTLAGGRVQCVLRMLAPNGRPAQQTSDLASFWDRTYPEIRKELRGRYPKHAWPEDPRSAEPSRPRRFTKRSRGS